MKIQDSVALVTGANRGLGQAIVRELQARGTRKIYAAARNPDSIDLPGVVPLKLDVTSAADIAAAAAQCGDVNLLVNNAGIADAVGVTDAQALAAAERIFATNFYGTLRLSQAFAPLLAANGGGAIINVLSVATWIASQQLGVYGASKAAAWSLTNSLRLQLAGQGTQVLGLHVGFMDTDMTRGFDIPKTNPATVATRLLDGLEAGALEVLADEVTQKVKQGLSAHPGVYLGALGL